MNRPIRNLLIGLGALSVIFMLGTFGYWIAGWPFIDAGYMVVLTIFSVGYGEVRPVESPELKLFTAMIIVLGCSTVIYIMGALIQILTEGQILNAIGGRRMTHELEKLSGHVIICGFGRVGNQIAADLDQAGWDYVVIDRDEDRLKSLAEKDRLYVVGDATDEEILSQAGIDRAATLATVLPSDAANVFITLSARNQNDSLRIVARGDFPSTESKLLQAGADKVVLPTHIGAERLAGLILRPDATDFFEQDAQSGHLADDLSEIGVQVEQIVVPEDSELDGATLEDLENRGRSAFLIVAVRRKSGESIHKPPLDTRLEGGDTLIVMCHAGVIPDFNEMLASRHAIQYRGATH